MTDNDAFSNPGTSKVFLALFKGKKNPKAIADYLEIQPPPVIEQLRRLRKMEVIKLGEKIGKEQTYEVEWDKFLLQFIKQATHARGQAKDEIEQNNAQTLERITELSRNEYFKQAIEQYLENLAVGLPPGEYTIREAIDNFENALLTTTVFKVKKSFEDKEKQAFFNSMRTWYEKTLSANTWLDLCLHDAFYKTLANKAES